MAAAKKKKQPQRARAQRRQQLQDYKPRLRQGTLRDSKIVVEPEGQIKMSAVLEDFVEPYLADADTPHARKVLFTLGELAWNAALLPEDKRRAMLDDVLVKGLKGLSIQDRKVVEDLVGKLIERKLALFGDIQRYIASFELTEDRQGMYLAVASVPMTPDNRTGEAS